MAIKKTITKQAYGQDVTIENAYIRVETVSGTKSFIHATVSFSVDQNGDEIYRNVYGFSPNLDAGNFIKQSYDHLKTLPEFYGALDC